MWNITCRAHKERDGHEWEREREWDRERCWIPFVHKWPIENPQHQLSLWFINIKLDEMLALNRLYASLPVYVCTNTQTLNKYINSYINFAVRFTIILCGWVFVCVCRVHFTQGSKNPRHSSLARITNDVMSTRQMPSIDAITNNSILWITENRVDRVHQAHRKCENFLSKKKFQFFYANSNSTWNESKNYLAQLQCAQPDSLLRKCIPLVSLNFVVLKWILLNDLTCAFRYSKLIQAIGKSHVDPFDMRFEYPRIYLHSQSEFHHWTAPFVPAAF